MDLTEDRITPMYLMHEREKNNQETINIDLDPAVQYLKQCMVSDPR